MVYAGRFIAGMHNILERSSRWLTITGLRIGQASVVAPVYLSEIAPRSLRGLCATMFAASVYIGIMLAYFANWGCQLHVSDTQSSRWARTL